MLDQIYCLRYPTSTVFVDDNEQFLKMISSGVSKESPPVIFSNPAEALKYIESKKYFNDISMLKLSENFYTPYGLDSNAYEIKFDISNLHKHSYLPDRFEEISTAVVDFSMPNINGDEFFHRIRNLPIKKIMLTGQADDTIATRLFNEGVIDCFIRKDDGKFQDKLKRIIKNLNNKYFHEKSKIYIDTIKSLVENKSEHMLDSVDFKRVFDECCNLNDIVEYYMFSVSGSFLMFDREGKDYWLLIATEQDILDYCEIAEHENISKSIIDVIEKGLKIPYFANKRQMFSGLGNSWETYLHDARKIEISRYDLIQMEEKPNILENQKLYLTVENGQIQYITAGMTKIAKITTDELGKPIPGDHSGLKLVEKAILSVTEKRGHTKAPPAFYYAFISDRQLFEIDSSRYISLNNYIESKML